MITPVTNNDYEDIITIWELSVRATHHFLPESYLQEIKKLLPSILPQVQLYAFRNIDGNIIGFAGVAEHKMEMLFIHSRNRGRGIGRKLAEFCIQQLKADKVDVNEQNDQAVEFYKKIGYKIIGRKELDSLDRPFPILEMQYHSFIR